MAASTTAGVVGTVFQSEVQKGTGWPSTTFYVAALLALVSQILGIAAAPPAMTLGTYADSMARIQTAIMLRPFDRGDKWTFDDWKMNFELLARILVERVASIRGATPNNSLSITCNLMVYFPKAASPDLQRLFGSLYPGATLAGTNPYQEDNSDDITSESDLDGYLAMVARYKVGAMEGRLISMRVHTEHRNAQPGGPYAIHAMKRCLSENPNDAYPQDAHTYLPDTLDLRPDIFPPDLSQKARIKIESYFTQRKRDLRSFISIALSWDGLPIGVLNIDSNQPHLLGKRKVEQFAFHSIQPFLPVVAALARVFHERYDIWTGERHDQ